MESLLSFRGEEVESLSWRCRSGEVAPKMWNMAHSTVSLRGGKAVSLSLGGKVDPQEVDICGEVAPLRGGKVERPEAER